MNTVPTTTTAPAVSAITRMAIEETYSEVAKLVHQTAYRFWRRYGGDIHEIISEAHEHYLAAYTTHSPRFSFSAWVAFRVFKCLLETRRLQARRAARMGSKVELETVAVSKQPANFNLDEFCSALSCDAQEVVSIITKDTPTELASTKITKGKLTNYLRDRGWSFKRINKAFEQITGLLSEF